MSENIYTTKKKTQVLFEASREFGVEVNTEKVKYDLRLRVFENRVPRKTFGCKREEVVGDKTA
jgi:hypothetical protein